MAAKSRGEPYGLAGNRLVFTNWHYIRQHHGWYYEDPNTKEKMEKSATVGPWDANLAAFDMPVGIRLVAQPAQRIGPLLKPERMWEEKSISLRSVIADGGIFRAWGETRSGAGQMYNCYFESRDGLNWKRPHVGLVECEGSTKNNILDIPGLSSFRITVFKDPAAPPDERYKGVGPDRVDRETLNAYLALRPDDWGAGAIREAGAVTVKGAVSPDGLRWRVLEEPLVVEVSDTQVVCHFDEVLGKYVNALGTMQSSNRVRRRAKRIAESARVAAA